LDSIVSTKYQTGTTPAGGPETQKKSLNYVTICPQKRRRLLNATSSLGASFFVVFIPEHLR